MATESQVQATDTLALQKKARRRLVGTIALVVLSLIILPQFLKNKSKIQPPNDPVVMMPEHSQLEQESVKVEQRTETSVASTVNESGFDTQAIAENLADQNNVGNPATDQANLAEATPEPASVDHVEAAQKTVSAEPTSESENTVAVAKPSATNKESNPKSAEQLAEVKQRSTNVASNTSTKPPKEVAKAEKSNAQQGYAVQLGVFANPENVKKMQAQIALAGFESKTSAVAKGTRLRVGYFVSKKGAEQALATLKQNGLAGKIVAR